MVIKIKDLVTGEILNWSIAQVLSEINRDRSHGWTDYDESDWFEGWSEWVDGEYYKLHEV